jgi:8-oxo-dGTP diphosphatase
MKRYTLGFIFDSTLKYVLLVHKNRPAWQDGKLNGIGGKIEKGENGLDCIVRETEEESGLVTNKTAWKAAGIMKGKAWQIEVFCTQYQGSMKDAQTIETETVEWIEADKLPENVIFNLRWLIPFCLDMIQQNELESFEAIYNENNPT